jgi:Fe-S oxidoreductase
MATYKAEFLAHHYAGRVRPRTHYSMGWLPLAGAVVARTSPRLVNTFAQAPGLSWLAKKAAGVDPRRQVPVFAPVTFQQWFAGRSPGGSGERGEVLLWPDTFTNHLEPGIAEAAVEVLEHAGWRVRVPERPVCCGLTWISTGQLDVAKRVLRRTIDTLRPQLRAGTPILGLEPSCTAVFRADAEELFPHDPDVERLRRQTVTLAELLGAQTPGWEAPRLTRTAHVQQHCHHHAVLGFDADAKLLADAGVDVDVLDSGCCGLAGNFGFEQGHYDVSEACAERVLLPAVRDADRRDVILADGFSCRTQIAQGDAGGRGAVHLVELLRAGLRGDDGLAHAERRWADRPDPPSRAARVAMTTATAGGLAATVIGAAVWAGRRVRR